MNPNSPLKTYLRGSNGFRQKKVFKRLLEHQDEGAFIMKNTQGFEIVIPAHFFESAYRRVKNIHTNKPLSAKYFTQDEINRLRSFIGLAEEKNRHKSYGQGTMQLILNVADAATKQRKHLMNKMNMSYQEAIADQKIKFSSRANRYPFVFSLLKDNKNRVLINTVYMRGDIYPLNTLIVYGI